MDFNDDCTALTMVQYTKAQVANYLNSVNAPEDEIDYVGSMSTANMSHACMHAPHPTQPFSIMSTCG